MLFFSIENKIFKKSKISDKNIELSLNIVYNNIYKRKQGGQKHVCYQNHKRKFQ